MTFQSRVSLAALAFIWMALLAVIWAFPTVLSIYGVLWILLPCQLVFVGFKSGVRCQNMRLKVMIILMSGVCEVIAALIIGALLNTFRGWNIYFSIPDYLVVGLVASSAGLFISFLMKCGRSKCSQR